MTLEPKEYQRIIDNQNEQIDELCAVIHAIRYNKIANIAPFVARLIKERNELDVARAFEMQRFLEVNSELNKCKYLTQHWQEVHGQ